MRAIIITTKASERDKMLITTRLVDATIAETITGHQRKIWMSCTYPIAVYESNEEDIDELFITGVSPATHRGLCGWKGNVLPVVKSALCEIQGLIIGPMIEEDLVYIARGLSDKFTKL